jgi:hypothetical protein
MNTVDCQSLSHQRCDNLAITLAKSVELKVPLSSALDGTYNNGHSDQQIDQQIDQQVDYYETTTKWIEICNKSESINKTLRIMQKKYGKSFPEFLDLSPGYISIINLTVFYSTLCLDMLPEEIEAVSISHTFNSKVNITITRSYSLLKDIIVDIDNIENILNLKELGQYAFDNDINLHFINSVGYKDILIETCI